MRNIKYLSMVSFLIFLFSSCNTSMDIYLMIGQSNMAGRADIELQDQDSLENVYLFTGITDKEWEKAANPLNKYSTIRKKLSMQKLNPGYTFAQDMAKAYPDKRIGLVVNAKGGTSISKWMPGTEFYDEAVKRTRQALKSGTLKGIIWHQGESDASKCDSYTKNILELIESLRSEFNMPDLPFVAGQLSEDRESRKIFNTMILQLPSLLDNVGVVSSDKTSTIDSTHFDSASQRLIGKRYATEMLKLQKIGPFLATGIKIGEVTQTEAIVWVRLTQNPERVGHDALKPDVRYKNPETGEMEKRKGGRRPDITPVVTYPDGYNINNIEGAVPGIDGQVRLKYKIKDSKKWMKMNWEQVNPKQGFTYQFDLTNLEPGAEYAILVEAAPSNSRKVSSSLKGKFKTAPSTDTPSEVNFIVTTGTSYGDVDSEDGYKIYPSSLKLDPEFFVHTGDIVYYDGLAKTADLARWHWDRMYSYPNNIEYHRQVASYFIKDDHDTWMNDAYPGMKTKFMGEFTYEDGTQIFIDEVPMREKTYRTVRWGKDLQIWLVEGRDYRSQNPSPDGPEKSIWGKEQMDWFKKTVTKSDAKFKVLISPTPVVGPDRGNKKDNHANIGFQHEGDMLRKFMSEQNMLSVCGDRHWQYVSKDAETGLLEFSCGPGGDDHAGGWSQDDFYPEHIYLNIVGGFFYNFKG